MTSSQKAIVYIFIPSEGYLPAGTFEHFPQEKRSTFQYGKKYLLRPNALPVDPVRIPLIDMIFETPAGQPVFNIFRDAAPDRWGRQIISIAAGVGTDTMTEFDVITALGPGDRIGALAFGLDPYSGPKYLASWYAEKTLPKEANNIKKIARYVRQVSELDDDHIDKFRNNLPPDDLFRVFVPSLSPAGGARPKALVRYEGIDWIAKFPKRGDIWNEPLIEHGCMTLAEKCGINTAQTQMIREDGIDILLVKRFDRDEAGNFLHMASGFTIADLLEDQSWGSYQGLANAARRYGASDVGEQIFRRMVFNICCANGDDHPRNHAFFIHRDRIELTPAYDITPHRFRFDDYSLALGVGKQGRSATLQNALSDTGPFGLSKAEAKNIIHNMQSIFSGWQAHFKNIGVTQKNREELMHRFSHSGVGSNRAQVDL